MEPDGARWKLDGSWMQYEGVRGSWMDLKNTNAQHIYEKKQDYVHRKSSNKKGIHIEHNAWQERGVRENNEKRRGYTHTEKLYEAEQNQTKKGIGSRGFDSSGSEKGPKCKKQMPFKMVQKFLWRLRVRSGRMNPMRDPPHFFGLSFLFCKKDAPVVASHSGL